jgi:hypothetical protein
MSTPSWTPANEQLLIQLWAEGVPSREIAAALGPQFTRNAILGRVHRMRGQGVEFAVRKDLRQGRPKGSRNKRPVNYSPHTRSAAKLAPTPIVESPIAIPLFEGVSILDASLGHCRAIIGRDDSQQRLVIFCGAPTVGKTSFCQGHFERFYQRRI